MPPWRRPGAACRRAPAANRLRGPACEIQGRTRLSRGALAVGSRAPRCPRTTLVLADRERQAWPVWSPAEVLPHQTGQPSEGVWASGEALETAGEGFARRGHSDLQAERTTARRPPALAQCTPATAP